MVVHRGTDESAYFICPIVECVHRIYWSHQSISRTAAHPLFFPDFMEDEPPGADECPAAPRYVVRRTSHDSPEPSTEMARFLKADAFCDLGNWQSRFAKQFEFVRSESRS